MGEPVPEWDEPLGAHVKNDFAATNEPFVAVRRARSGPAVRAEFVEVTTTRLAQLDALTDAEWAAVGWSPMGEVPHAEFMTVRVYDSWVHEQDVRRALDRPGGSGNAASAISLGRMQDAMPFVVGKKAGCAEGTAVRFDVAGPGDDARAFTIAVEGGRARPVADDVTPTVTLSLSSIDFMRLGCGRATAAQVEAAGGIARGRRRPGGPVRPGRHELHVLSGSPASRPHSPPVLRPPPPDRARRGPAVRPPGSRQGVRLGHGTAGRVIGS